MIQIMYTILTRTREVNRKKFQIGVRRADLQSQLGEMGLWSVHGGGGYQPDWGGATHLQSI